MAHDVFVSHSAKDAEVAKAIVTRLEAESIRCWIAPRDVVPGADWGESIIDAIESSRIMILVFSRNANESRQIKREVERADDKGVYIIPFRIDDSEPTKSLEYFISTAQWMNAFSPPLEPHLDDLTKAVATVLSGSSRPATVPNESKTPKIRPTVVGEQVLVRRQGISSERRTPLPLRSWILPVAIVVILIAAGAGWYFGHERSGPRKSVVPQGTEELGPLATQAQDANRLKVAQKMITNIPPPAGAQAIPKIAGIWRDSDYLAVSQITQDGDSFRFTRWGTLANGTRFESSGSGTISGQRFTSTYNARYQTNETSWGECSGYISSDGMHIELNCRDSLFGAFGGAANHE